MKVILKAILVILSVSLVFFACSKDKVETKPHLSLRSISSKIIPVNNDMTVNMDFTDEEGDLDSVHVWKTRTNKRKPVNIVRNYFKLKVPEFAKNNIGQLQLLLEYQDHLISASPAEKDPITGKLESDSLTMKFVLKDKAGHASDTVYLNDVVILRQL